MMHQYEVIDENGRRALLCVECHRTGGDHSTDCAFLLRLARKLDEQWSPTARKDRPMGEGTSREVKFMAFGFLVIFLALAAFAVLAAGDRTFDSCTLYDFVPVTSTPARCIPALSGKRAR